jgi:hypothetical protein
MKWCERCGGPVRPLKYQVHPVDGHNGCRVCALEDLARWGAMDRHLIADGPVETEPCPHASGWWLPEGAREALRTTIDYDAEDCLAWPDDDEIALEKWHRQRYV